MRPSSGKRVNCALTHYCLLKQTATCLAPVHSLLWLTEHQLIKQRQTHLHRWLSAKGYRWLSHHNHHLVITYPQKSFFPTQLSLLLSYTSLSTLLAFTPSPLSPSPTTTHAPHSVPHPLRSHISLHHFITNIPLTFYHFIYPFSSFSLRHTKNNTQPSHSLLSYPIHQHTLTYTTYTLKITSVIEPAVNNLLESSFKHRESKRRQAES